MDCISIKNLEVFGKHGVFEEENKLGQKFSVSAQLYLDTRQAIWRNRCIMDRFVVLSTNS